MHSFPVPVLGFLLVSFRPSQFRSRSRSTGAYLLLSLSAFSLLFGFLSIASSPGPDYSASALSFPFFPVFPGMVHSGAFIRFLFCLFPCIRFRFGTQPSVLPFSGQGSASQWLLPCLSLRPVSFVPFSPAVPLSMYLRFRLLGLGEYTLKTEYRIIILLFLSCNHTEPALWSSFRLISISQLHTLLYFHL